MKNIFKPIIYLAFCSLYSNIIFADSYYVMIDGKQNGPKTMEQLSELKQSGQLFSDSMVWKDGMAGWKPAGSQSSLQSLFSVMPPPPPMTPAQSVAPPPPPVALNSTVNSQSSMNQSDVNELNKMADPKSVQSASDSIDDWADKAVRNFGRNEGEFGEKNGKFILFASQSVSIKSTDPQYGDALINAYDKALTKIQEEYVMIRFGKTITEKAKSFYSDRSTDADNLELPPRSDPRYHRKMLAVFEKSLDVADKKLDKELIELGEDPQKFKMMPVKIKKDLFRDKFFQKAIRKASGSISGLFPLQTAVISDKSGKNVVGIIAIASPKTIQIAKDIKLQRPSLVKGKGRDISTLLPASNEDYLHVFGTRLAYDIDASPVIISYGVSSYRADTGDDYINDELKSEARNAAISNADAQIAEIINGHMSVNNERKRGEEIKKFVEREVRVDSDTIEKTIKSIIKITNNQTKSSASAKLQGISTVKRWRYTAKTGQKFVGAVRVWKYSTLKSINNFNKSKYSNKSKKVMYQDSMKASQPVNSIDDF